jgi:hypothetical protein
LSLDCLSAYLEQDPFKQNLFFGGFLTLRQA